MTLIPKKAQVTLIMSFVAFIGYILARHLSLEFDASDLRGIYNSGYKVSIVSENDEATLNGPEIEDAINVAVKMESKWFVDLKGSKYVCSLNFSHPKLSEIYSIQFYRKGGAISTRASVVDGHSQYYFGFYYGNSLYGLLTTHAPNICGKI